MDAIVKANAVKIRKFSWSIIDVEDHRDEALPYIFGRLAKYSVEGHVALVDPERKAVVDADAPNLLEASSPFVYLPQHSGIAFLHIWNEITDQLFPKRFKRIVEAAIYDEAVGEFFAECSIEAIADYREFVAKIRELDRITELRAKVNPPNPLFGDVWRRLKQYIDDRNAEEILVQENSVPDQGLHTNLIAIAEAIVDGSSHVPEASITDAAILMAADGYGSGKIEGVTGNSRVTIRTRGSQKTFSFAKNPAPYELAAEVDNRLASVSEERNMEH